MGTKYITSDSATYLKYIANLSQSGGIAPTAVILENTLGEIPTYSYSSAGNYNINFSVVSLDTSRTYIVISPKVLTADGSSVFINGMSPSTIEIITLDSTNTGADGILENTTIEIRVY
jgi:hypothetical protein